MMKKLSEIGEFGLIEKIRQDIVIGGSVVKGIGDDAAVVVGARHALPLLLTTDMLVEGVHFTKATSAKAVGHKALAASVSDIAAMGGLPKYALVSLGVSGSLSLNFVNDLYAGMNALAKKFGVSIVGGDTVKSEKLIINVALTGEAGRKNIVYRSGANPGDLIFVTGPLGGSLKSGKHLTFTPRIKESQYLVKHFKPTSMIDISDGLAADLGHILEESRVGAVLEEEDIPLNPKAALANAFYDGEDFELIFTLSKKGALTLGHKKHRRFPFICIGEIVKGAEKIYLIDRQGRQKTIPKKGSAHF